MITGTALKINEGVGHAALILPDRPRTWSPPYPKPWWEDDWPPAVYPDPWEDKWKKPKWVPYPGGSWFPPETPIGVPRQPSIYC